MTKTFPVCVLVVGWGGGNVSFLDDDNVWILLT